MSQIRALPVPLEDPGAEQNQAAGPFSTLQLNWSAFDVVLWHDDTLALWIDQKRIQEREVSFGHCHCTLINQNLV